MGRISCPSPWKAQGKPRTVRFIGYAQSANPNALRIAIMKYPLFLDRKFTIIYYMHRTTLHETTTHNNLTLQNASKTPAASCSHLTDESRMREWRSGVKTDSACLWVLEQPCGRSLATRLGGAAAVALLHLAVHPRGLLRVLLVPLEPLCVRPAENAARVLRPQRGRRTQHGEPTSVADLDALSV